MKLNQFQKKLAQNGNAACFLFPSWMTKQLEIDNDQEVTIDVFDRDGKQVVEMSWPLKSVAEPVTEAEPKVA